MSVSRIPRLFKSLAELTVYLALAPKSNAIYRGYGAVRNDVAMTRNDPVPIHLRNAPTELMKNEGYGKGYRYAHDFAEGIIGQQNVPDNVRGRRYYEPTDRGYERELARRIERIREIYRQTEQDASGDASPQQEPS
jgi:putative ATPase